MTDMEKIADEVNRLIRRSIGYDTCENLTSAYGYYIDDFLWDDFADFFTCHQLIQPVIHVSDDGRSADIRVRLFQLSGPDGTDGVWMAGILEKKAAICRFTTSTPSVEEGRACYYSDRNTCLPFGFSVAEHHGLMYKFVIYYNI